MILSSAIKSKCDVLVKNFVIEITLFLNAIHVNFSKSVPERFNSI
jgi:hypothetical protein